MTEFFGIGNEPGEAFVYYELNIVSTALQP